MRKLLILGILILTVNLLSAQNAEVNDNIQDPNFQTHKGFYLSMGLGLNYSSVSTEVKNMYDLLFTGQGTMLDLKLGGTIKENLVLHGTLLSWSMNGPEVSSGSMSENTSNNLTLGEAMMGVGLTYYQMPANIYFSGSLGMSALTVIDGDENTSYSTDRGIAIQLKVGKEWWVSKRWGLGLALTYINTNIVNTPGGSTKEYVKCNNFGIQFNATLN